MKIRIFFEIEDGVYIVRAKTEDWSEADSNLMLRFGEPEIDAGGEIVVFTEVTGTHTGTDNATTLVDSTKTWVADAFIGRAINRTSPTSASSVVTDNTTNTIATQDTLVWAGSPAPSDYVLPKVSFLLPIDYRRIRTESPFVRKFDSRDYSATSLVGYTVPEALRPTAKVMALAWASAIESRLSSAVTTLRTNIDSYTGEDVETV